MIKLIPLFSGSSGNCTLIQTSQQALLLDMGYSFRAVLSRLKQLGVNPQEVCGIVITHEHSDHIGALKSWTKNFHTQVYAPANICNYISQTCFCSDVFPISQPFGVGDVSVDFYQCSHDARQCFGYRFTCEGESVASVTDTGTVTSELVEFLSPCRAIMLESNHDVEMLQNGNYPFFLKNRIASSVGHLSNDQATYVLEKLIGSNVKSVALAHLSQQNNTKSLAYATAEKMYQKHGVTIGKDVLLYVADQYENKEIL